MELQLTKENIQKTKQHIDVDGYSLLIRKIENNINTNPDIAIESCKSLIEGLSKKALSTLSEEYNNSKKLRKDCNNKLPTLVKTAFDHVYQTTIEVDLFEPLYQIISDKVKTEKIIQNANQKLYNRISKTISKIDAVRGNKGDISHGRIYPKLNESSIQFAKSIILITDAICSYMLHEMLERYKEIESSKDTLNYYDEKLKEFNRYLDESFEIKFPNFPIQSQLYSKILFDYELNEYLIQYKEFTENEFENKDSEILKDEKSYIDFPPISMGKIMLSDINSKFFTEEKQKELIRQLAEEEQLNPEKLTEIIDIYFFDSEFPSKGKIADLFTQTPTDEKTKVLVVERKIDELIENLAEIL